MKIDLDLALSCLISVFEPEIIIPFKSYTQPLVIMAAIPFGLTGAVIGHIIMGQNITVLSFIGIVALSGVVVNDSLNSEKIAILNFFLIMFKNYINE